MFDLSIGKDGLWILTVRKADVAIDTLYFGKGEAVDDCRYSLPGGGDGAGAGTMAVSTQVELIRSCKTLLSCSNPLTLWKSVSMFSTMVLNCERSVKV